jgi:hypothetical protein
MQLKIPLRGGGKIEHAAVFKNIATLTWQSVAIDAPYERHMMNI